jgi:hypothetical protein
MQFVNWAQYESNGTGKIEGKLSKCTDERINVNIESMLILITNKYLHLQSLFIVGHKITGTIIVSDSTAVVGFIEQFFFEFLHSQSCTNGTVLRGMFLAVVHSNDPSLILL